MITLASPDGLVARPDHARRRRDAEDRADLNATGGGLTVVADTWAEVSLDQGLPEQTRTFLGSPQGFTSCVRFATAT